MVNVASSTLLSKVTFAFAPQKIDEQDENTELLVSLGRTVTFDVLEDGEPEGEPESYKIVGSAEADPAEGRISNDSPMAKALMGHKVSDKVKITTPGGDMEVVILEIK